MNTPSLRAFFFAQRYTLSGASFNLVDRHFEASILRAFRGVRLRHVTRRVGR